VGLDVLLLRLWSLRRGESKGMARRLDGESVVARQQYDRPIDGIDPKLLLE
jgi:hypothetical protein